MTTHCGYIAIIGRPNVGKSTLINHLLAKKISITSDKPQTTRFQILGIKTIKNSQAVYIDTPGIHHNEKQAMNRYLNRLATGMVEDADVIIFMIEANRWLEEDEYILQKIKTSQAPVILAINKVDKIKDKNQLLPFIEKIQNQYHFHLIISLSALKNKHIEELEKQVFELLPEGPFLFPVAQITDKPPRFQVAEIIREKLMRATGQEVPYSTAIEIETFQDEEKILRIHAIIWVERPGQKTIIIGKAGERLKSIGTLARQDIETLIGKKVFLRLWVKVKDNWTDDERALQSLGYI